MNEKFKKDEVWGSLGKVKGSGSTRDGTVDDPTCGNLEFEEGFGHRPQYDSKVSHGMPHPLCIFWCSSGDPYYGCYDGRVAIVSSLVELCYQC